MTFSLLQRLCLVISMQALIIGGVTFDVFTVIKRQATQDSSEELFVPVQGVVTGPLEAESEDDGE